MLSIFKAWVWKTQADFADALCEEDKPKQEVVEGKLEHETTCSPIADFGHKICYSRQCWSIQGGLPWGQAVCPWESGGFENRRYLFYFRRSSRRDRSEKKREEKLMVKKLQTPRRLLPRRRKWRRGRSILMEMGKMLWLRRMLCRRLQTLLYNSDQGCIPGSLSHLCTFPKTLPGAT